MRALFLLTASALGILVAAGAAAQDTPANPPEPTSPAEPPAAPPPEPAPPPHTPPPPAPPTVPPVVLPETPEPPPAKPPKKEVKAADITLEETPEAPKKKKKGGAHPAKKAQETEPPPEKEPEATPPPSHEQGSKPSPDEKPEKSEGEKSDEDKKKKDDGEGLLGPFRMGFLVGTGLPSILSFGGIIKLTRYFGAGVNVGLIPAIRLAYYGEADLSYQEGDIYGRIFPFGGALFAGAGVGYAHVAGSFKTTVPIPPVPNVTPGFDASIGSEASVRTLVLIPTIGLLHTFGVGFTIGIDAGAQIPIAPSETTLETRISPTPPREVQQQYIDPNEQQVKRRVLDTLDTMSRTIIPTLNFRIGWLI